MFIAIPHVEPRLHFPTRLHDVVHNRLPYNGSCYDGALQTNFAQNFLNMLNTITNISAYG